MICFLRGVWYNLRYFNNFLLRGYLASGHNYSDKTAEIHQDHWHLFCSNCGHMIASDTAPERIKEI